MTDFDVIEFTHVAAKEGQKYNEKTILNSFKGNDYNPYVLNKVFMILFGDKKRF